MTQGDTFLFYTDGLSDAVRGPERERDTLGVDRLSSIFSDLCAVELERHRRRRIPRCAGISRFVAGGR